MAEELDKQLTKGLADIKHQARLNMEELKTQVKAAADGYGGTLEGIQRELKDLNEKFDTKFGDHDLVLADHNQRIVKLEKR